MISFMHLTVFQALMRAKSVGVAAEMLDMPQPTLSRHLKQLREHFGNQLFVRTSRGLEPTSLAITAAPAVSQTLELYHSRLSGEPTFDPATSNRDFHIAASDVGHLLVLPRVLQWVRDLAPGVRFKAIPLGGEKLIARLETGEVDIAIGSFPALYAGVVEQTLFPEEYVCVVPRSYLPAGRLTMNRFKAARHVLVDGRHLGHIHEDVEKLLRKIVGPSNITVMAESFLLSAHIAEQSELILTTPSRLTGLLNTKSVRILKPPVALPGFTVKQYWHERFHDDPGNRWLRGILSRMRGLSEEGEGPSLPEFAGGAAEGDGASNPDIRNSPHE
ncbi:LysR-family transcriptional regulator [Sphingobium indicum UT26S]|uniref:LysR-family transcriptional regulator n=3 Tax=Sphingomonadaceae TaxID=41297 RepID=D4Z6Y9_SPHIU|nr:putative LysR-type transcriptional regulator [Sphingobium indicum]BAI98847.1 LysR-family transcriptional regulator [Sphingobium indicum UT26S]